MQHEELYLQDMVRSCRLIASFLKGISKPEFLSSKLLQSAVIFQLTIIGEGAAKVSSELKNKHPEVEWKVIIGMRNIAVHAYFSLKWETVLDTALIDIPGLEPQIIEILNKEFPDFQPRFDD